MPGFQPLTRKDHAESVPAPLQSAELASVEHIEGRQDF
ncbi:hypothetical protein Dthio_PD1558 [Desulfonatronospira thiodismutans ASO3-1]|uniref:Uncharacterized protein n=1 Tax=Desulfonatronospira thiodismutans ASO3-1 TaxID=555779 RepID=D6SN81_9BACT|nr:hypothetical protein Dthio_PD1558 [Desulfonatronospira thiodismutans ASO3-1]